MFEERALAVTLAYLLDLVLGDPPWLPHPVRGMGWLIQKTEPFFRGLTKNERLGGTLFAITVIATVWSASYLSVAAVSSVSAPLGFAWTVVLAYTAFAVKDLKVEAMRVHHALRTGDLTAARRMLSRIVGRDTDNLDGHDVMRASVETVAENTVDGVVAPLFYAWLGAAPLALAYKAVSTLDSMVGYKNKKYRDFGWFAARADDWANFLPARLTALLLPCVSWIAGCDAKGAWKIMLRDRKNHASPNSGIPEAAIAGALGLRLGGLSFCNGIPEEKPFIGDDLFTPQLKHIAESTRIMFLTSALFMTTLIFLSMGHAPDWTWMPFIR